MFNKLSTNEVGQFRYALMRELSYLWLSLPFTSLVSGIDSREVLKQNLDIARRFTPMTVAEMEALRTRVARYALDGRFELFKSTTRYNGLTGHEQHKVSQEPLLCSMPSPCALEEITLAGDDPAGETAVASVLA